jgi:hypothetical protein
MAKLYNLARMTTATTGTGTITLGSAVSSYLSFAASGVQNGDTVTYAIIDGLNREVGRGVYTSSGTTLTRTVLESTNSNTAINLSGNAEVFITAAAEDIANVNETNTFAANQVISVTDNSNAALRVTQLGTGNAILVEDSSNPDSTPFVVTASGDVGVGNTSPSQKLDVTGNIKWSGATYENIFTITDGASVDLNPANGTIQLWTLGASRSPTATSFANGQSMTLMIDDGSAFSITWPSVTWVNNGKVAPTLATTGFTVVALWKVSTTLYGALVGDGT